MHTYTHTYMCIPCKMSCIMCMHVVMWYYSIVFTRAAAILYKWLEESTLHTSWHHTHTHTQTLHTHHTHTLTHKHTQWHTHTHTQILHAYTHTQTLHTYTPTSHTQTLHDITHTLTHKHYNIQCTMTSHTHTHTQTLPRDCSGKNPSLILVMWSPCVHEREVPKAKYSPLRSKLLWH